MDIHHHRSFLPVSARRPDVQAQAVLAGGTPIDGGSISKSCRLQSSRSEPGCIEHTGPRLGWLRWEKTTVSEWRMREWNAFPDHDGALFEALYVAIGCFNERCFHTFIL